MYANIYEKEGEIVAGSKNIREGKIKRHPMKIGCL